LGSIRRDWQKDKPPYRVIQGSQGPKSTLTQPSPKTRNKGHTQVNDFKSRKTISIFPDNESKGQSIAWSSYVIGPFLRWVTFSFFTGSFLHRLITIIARIRVTLKAINENFCLLVKISESPLHVLNQIFEPWSFDFFFDGCLGCLFS